MSPKHYLVVDLEATCSEDNAVPKHEMEMIEIGAVMVSAATLQPVDEFQTFIRPVRHPILTDFCKQLTSITQSQVESAPLFSVGLEAFMTWANGFSDFVFCSWGRYDRTQFERDCKYMGIAYPLGERHINLKAEFANSKGVRKMGLSRALEHIGLKFQGSHHRGIDDARNIAALLPYIFSPEHSQ